MPRLLSALETTCRVVLGAAFLILAGAVLLQVTARTFLPQSPVWTEELARFALLYLAALGAGLALRTGDLVNVDLAVQLLPTRVRRVVDTLTALAVAGFAAWLIQPALAFMAIGRFQTSPALGWRMDWIFAAMPLVMVMLTVFGLIRALDAWRGRPPSLLDAAGER